MYWQMMTLPIKSFCDEFIFSLLTSSILCYLWKPSFSSSSILVMFSICLDWARGGDVEQEKVQEGREEVQDKTAIGQSWACTWGTVSDC